MSNRNVRDDVDAELDFDPFVDDTRIDVQVAHRNHVVLSGTVPTYAQSDEAVDAAWRVGDVTEVTNELVVSLDGYLLADEDLTGRADQALTWNVAVPAGVTAVAVDGVVTVTGVVEWAYQRLAAYNAVRHLTGVRRVDNEVEVTPGKEVADIDATIGDALGRLAVVESASEITVTSDGSTVYLDGHVRTSAERDAVDDAAWMVPGVADVQDRLLVTG